ncbi:hypothetical protein QQZ08_004485 [Neonectria magnoliae]|uniref:Uncharacterized protein n=1 Tax=Neonectria magnoliae TaxID=2732573 RepID=A0ABR1I7Z1_9HYPO
MANPVIHALVKSHHIRYNFFIETVVREIAAYRRMLESRSIDGTIIPNLADADPDAGMYVRPSEQVDVHFLDDVALRANQRAFERQLMDQLHRAEARLLVAKSRFPAPVHAGEFLEGGPVNFVLETQGFAAIKQRFDGHVRHKSLCCAQGFREFVELVNEITEQIDHFTFLIDQLTDGRNARAAEVSAQQ